MAQSYSIRRLGSTMGAQAYSQLVTVGVQLASVPLLIAFWGADRYGGWLVLAAIPIYLTLSDFGFTFIAKNEMVMQAVSGRHEGMLRTYHSVFALLSLVGVALVAVLGIAIWLAPLESIFTLGPITQSQARLVLSLLMVNVVATQFFLLYCAGVRAAGRPAAEVTWGATGKLLEAVAIVVGASLSSNVVVAAAGSLAARLVCMACLAFWLNRIAPALPLSYRQADRSEIRRLFSPSISYMMVSLSNAVMIQGPVIILGMLATPVAVVTFSTTRTLTRMGTSAANLINFSFSPEYSRLWGGQNWNGFLRLEKLHLIIGATGIVVYALGLALFGGWIMQLWTHGVVPAEQPFFGLMIAAVAAEMAWAALFTPIAAINRHMKVSNLFGALSIVAIIACYMLAMVGGISAVGAAIVVVHVIMLVYIIVWANPFRLHRPHPDG